MRVHRLLAALIVLSVHSAMTVAQQLTPAQQREIRAEAGEIAKAMMAEAMVRACPQRFGLVPSAATAHRKMLVKGANWNPDQANDIAAQVQEFRSIGCDAVVATYRADQGRYSSIRLSR